MKKTFKRLSAVALSTVLTFSVGAMAYVPVTSAYEVTVNKPSSDTATHTYEAYQVFSGTLHVSGSDVVLSDVDWGTGIKSADLLNELKDTTFGDTKPFETCTDAKGVAKILDDWADNADNLKKFADIVGKHLDTATVTGTAGNNKLTISDPGYYFIKDKDGTLDGNKNGAYTDYILKVVNSVEIDAKEDVPAITKTIIETNGPTVANTASIGEPIDFQINSKVPDMSAYDKYFFVINDTMCDGLTFNPDSVKVYIGDSTTAVNTDDYEVQTGTAAGSYTFQIVMKDFKAKHNSDAGKAVKVTYQAALNKDADISDAGNVNTVNLTYSNNPNVAYTGENEPSGTDPTGITPDSKTKTYTTGIMLKKIDGSTKLALTGAEFKLSGSGVNKVVITSSSSFKEDTNGTFYKLKDGTYTQTAPETGTESQYASTTVKYRLDKTLVNHSGSGTDSSVTSEVDDMGIITFEGLSEGTYTLTETKAPNGYNTISPIEIVITANPTFDAPNWKVTKGGNELSNGRGIYDFTVENNMGVTLPGTGGIGTTIFYVVGGMLVAAAFVLLITKKRMNIKNK